MQMWYSSSSAKNSTLQLNYEVFILFNGIKCNKSQVTEMHTQVLNKALADWLISNQYLI